MSQLTEKNPQEKTQDFKWGIERGVGVKKKDIMFYESFTYKGTEYFLYDCVYFNDGSQTEAYIGKLVKMYEGSNRVKKVKVIWFFRPSEIRKYLGDYQPRWNEIFLASGQGRGVSNINLVEAISGKCSVVCTSKDSRNPQASKADLKWADYFFCRHFDVGKLAILDVLPDVVEGVKVEYFFNKKPVQKPLGPPNLKSTIKEKTGISNFSFKLKLEKSVGNGVKDVNSGSRVNLLTKESKSVPIDMSKQVDLPIQNSPPRRKTSVPNDGSPHGGSSHYQAQNKDDKAEVTNPKDPLSITAEVQPYKKRKLLLDEMTSSKFDKLDCQPGEDGSISIDNQFVQVSRRPDAPWEQRLERAQEEGCLVSLENLDASYSSEEVEDILWNVFKEKVDAKMIEKSNVACPYYGKALIIFKSKEAADSAISQLMKRCLVLSDGRPVIARKGTLTKPDKSAGFVGHHTIGRVPFHKQSYERKAKSTSHATQPNNVEYEMAMEWRMLQEKSDICWKALHEVLLT
ncbi:hypothetical protein CCACVL1_27942 [Corchorus capsularis]|uniref:BAH domain-containing protein n=1 Tax=Corchorus capsularis TaxID=210143 RepID=A0A1R3G860_COCAP|nr:hypothetical protein CCACVL1_27942 [Corchorus capsularis]